MRRSPLHTRFIAVGIGMAIAVSASSCSTSGHDPLAADAPEYQGLPAQLVVERVGDPAFVQSIQQNFPVEEQANVMQLNIVSTQWCRDTLAAYQGWLATGVVPEPLVALVPSSPSPDYESFMGDQSTLVTTAIASGDPTQLRDYMLAGASCGSFVADPQDSGLRTIEDVLRGT